MPAIRHRRIFDSISYGGGISALQEQYLSALLRHNFEALRNFGILNTISNARRNDPCPCGSGKKFKHCHGANA
jgi:uncharacterized protein YchJ